MKQIHIVLLRYPRIFCELSCNRRINLGIPSVDLNTPLAIQQLWIIDDACLQRYRPGRTERLRKTADNGLFSPDIDLLAQFEDHQRQMFQIPANNHFQSDCRTGEAPSHWLMKYSSNIHLHPASSDQSIPPLWQRWRPQCPAGHMEQSSTCWMTHWLYLLHPLNVKNQSFLQYL